MAHRALAAALVLAALAVPSLAEAAVNDTLTIGPATGVTLSGALTFTSPAAGCAAGNSALVRMAGPGIADAEGINIIGATEAAPGTQYVTNSGGVPWDGIAQANAIPRPLNGTYTVKIVCLDDGDPTGQFFDRDVSFTQTGTTAPGQPGTWVAVGDGGPEPDPEPDPFPSPSPSPSHAPSPSPAPDRTQSFTLRVPDLLPCGLGGPGSCGGFSIGFRAGTNDGAFGPLTFGSSGTQTFAEASTDIAPVYVSDTRPGRPAWQVVARLSRFLAPSGAWISASNAGWEPVILSATAMGATPGPAVTPGYPSGGTGMAVTRVLASAPTGHGGSTGQTAELGGRITVRLPFTATRGDYRTTLTVTAIS